MSSWVPAGKRKVALVIAAWALSSGCRERYRVGEYVLVSWCEGEYPAYILAKKGPARYRVHFEGYAERWDSEVGIDEIKRRLDEPLESSPPLCDKVAHTMGVKVEPDKSDPIAPYEVGAKVSVTWRGTVYKATIIEVVDRDRYRIHYDGHESAWDEVITQERIVKGR